LKRIFFGSRLEEKIKRIVNRHLGDEINFNEEFRGFIGNGEAREVIAEGVLLPVEKMFFGKNFLRVAENGRAAMRRGSQADDVRRMRNRAVVQIMGAMIKCDVYGHESVARWFLCAVLWEFDFDAQARRRRAEKMILKK
jgi:hypothetical protein